MSQLPEIARNHETMSTMVDITGIFESIASMRIARIKNQVLQSTHFFNDLWGIYIQLRVDSLFRFGREDDEKVNQKELFIVITSEGGFSGDIDEKVIELMLKSYSKENNDIIVIGRHGTVLLAQRGISFEKYFRMPKKDQNINTQSIVEEIQNYKDTVVFYQEYTSLMNQNVKSIELKKAVAEKGKVAEESDEVISEENYIFEPDTYAVVEHLERSMLKISVSQLIFESKLAQNASRFSAMTRSKQAATDSLKNIGLNYSRTRRGEKDTRLKETINGIRKRQSEEVF